VPAAGLQHAPGLVHGQRALVAECVAADGQRGAGRQHLLHHHVDVPGFRRQVRAQEGRHQLGRRPPVDLGDHLQEPPLGLGVEPVARLDLDRRRAAAQACPRPRRGLLDQLVERRLARRLDRPHDAAGGVRSPHQPGGELVGPVPGEGQMGVSVHEPGHDGPAGGVQLGLGRAVEVTLGDDPLHPSVADHDGQRPSTGVVIAEHPAGPPYDEVTHPWAPGRLAPPPSAGPARSRRRRGA
jgi:hypothetical protein